ncbi:MAG: hypothetical protein ABW167_21310 [Baekduia sp.]
MSKMMVVALLVAAMAGVVVVRTSGGSGDGAASGAPPTTSWDLLQREAGTAPPGAARAALRQAIGAARGTPGRVPQALQKKVLASLGAPADVAFEDAHRIETSHGAVWLTHLRRATCMIRAHDGSLACDATPRVTRKGLLLGVYAVSRGRPHDFILLGIAPDWARRARLRIDKRTREVAVHDNTYAMAAARPIQLDRLLR